MGLRIASHIIFWLTFAGIYALMAAFFAGPSDLVYPPAQRFFRFLFSELAVVPAKALPFYLLVYILIPKLYNRRRYLEFILTSAIVILAGVFLYRFVTPIISIILYQERPDYNTYSFARLFYTFTEMLPAFGLAASAKLLKAHFRNQKRQADLQQEKLSSELNFLKAQTNPHFLFNTLNNLYGLARKQDNNTAPSILKLSNIMRFILYECAVPRISLSKEITIIEDYIALERLRYDERLEVNFTYQTDLQEQLIAPLLLLPFVENAFKHGASESRTKTAIDIKLACSGDQLWFTVFNTKHHYPEQPDSGIGLNNVRRQLELTYPKVHQL
ncbi:MAG: histidine kinase, partial [Bacteroidota bacterium]